MSTMSHDGLAQHLAGHLRGDRRMVWTDMQLGPAGSPRPDVFTMDKSFVASCPTAYECKVSRSDFLADATAGKWQSYLKFASAVYFACEGDLIRKAEVPDQCGLYRLVNGKWRAAKRPILTTVEMPRTAWLKLIIDGVEREGPRYRARAWSDHDTSTAVRRQFGEDVSLAVRDLQRARWDVESATRSAERIIADAQRRADSIKASQATYEGPLWAELCAAVGLNPTDDHYLVRAKIQEIKAAHRDSLEIAAPQMARAAAMVRRLADQLDNQAADIQGRMVPV